jgi:hypothetical protein
MLTDKHFPKKVLTVELTFEDANVMTTLALTDEMNHNITAPQRELTMWHQKWSHCDTSRVQTLLATSSGKPQSQLIEPNHDKASSCPKPKCATCCLRNTGRSSAPTTQVLDTSERNLNDAVINPGDVIHLDQYMMGLHGRLPTTFGKENPKKKFTGGIIFVDGKTGFVHHYHQVSLRVRETLQGNNRFEKGSGQFNVKIKTLRSDNAPFNAAEFKNDLDNKYQSIAFSGVGAHHQNGAAERAIKTINVLDTNNDAVRDSSLA